MLSFSSQTYAVLFGLAIFAAYYIGLHVLCAAWNSIPNESRGVLVFLVLISIIMLMFAPVARIPHEHPTDKSVVSIPVSIPIDLICSPWKPTSGKDVFFSGNFAYGNLLVWIYVVLLCGITSFYPLVPILNAPLFFENTLTIVNERPEQRGTLTGVIALLLLVCGSAGLSLLGVLILPHCLTVYVNWLALMNLAALGDALWNVERNQSSEYRPSTEFYILGGAAGAELGQLLRNERVTQADTGYPQRARSLIAHFVLVGCGFLFLCSPAIPLAESWLRFWFRIFNLHI